MSLVACPVIRSVNEITLCSQGEGQGRTVGVVVGTTGLGGLGAGSTVIKLRNSLILT